jgi:rod shape-determining protein MreD
MRKSLLFVLLASLILTFQEVVISRIAFPFANPSIFLIFIISWAFLEEQWLAALQGFLAGLILDISPLSVGVIGHWAFVLAAICYGVSELGVQLRGSRRSPLTLTVVVTAGIFFTLIFFVISGALINSNQGYGFMQTVPGVVFWSLVFTPLISPLIVKAKRAADGVGKSVE